LYYSICLEELCDNIEEAAKRREKIKAVSTKYSEMWTDISGSDGIVIDTSRYDMKTTDLSQVTDKLYHIMLYTSP
jgi:hypothetical protein